MPYRWFLHLERAEDESLLRSDEMVDKLGFVAGAKTKYNRDGLPVGFAKDTDPATSR